MSKRGSGGPKRPRNDDLRFNRKPVKLKHRSSRGHVQRNSGNFTRGSQLLTHEILMTFAGVRIPLMAWFGIFVTSLCLTLWMLMREHEVQLVLMKAWSDIWVMMDFDPQRVVNLTLPNGATKAMPMASIPIDASVDRAWSKAVRCVAGSGFMALFIAAPVTLWFFDISRRRGRTILEEHHERGALLVERDVLINQVRGHNRDKLAEECLTRDPPLDPKPVLRMGLRKRQELGFHVPYTIGGIPFPYRLEQSHTMIIGTTGTGKTTQIKSLIEQTRKRGHRAVVFDLTGALVEIFYDPKSDIILNPMDKRMRPWNLFDESKDYGDWVAIANALIPSSGGGGDEFWENTARTLFVEMCMKLEESGETSNAAIAYHMMTADLKIIHARLKDTSAGPLTAKEVAKMAQGIRAAFIAHAGSFGVLPEPTEENGPPFSIVDWITGDFVPGSILFITCSYSDLALNRTLLSLWMDLAVNSTFRLPKTRDLRTWFFFDEVHALHRLPALEHGLQTTRTFGGAFVLGMHSFDKLVETYGEEGAVHLSSLARTKLILATADRKTAEVCSEFIGNREVRQMDEAYSYGYNNTRDASTLTPRKLVEPLVIPDDIANLPSMHGFVKFPDGFPAAPIKLVWKNYPEVANGFERRTNVKRIEYHPPAPKPEQAGPTDETDSARGDVDKQPQADAEKGAQAHTQSPTTTPATKLTQAEIDANNLSIGVPPKVAGAMPAPANDTGPEKSSGAPPTDQEQKLRRTLRANAFRESLPADMKDKAADPTLKSNEKVEETDKTSPVNGKQGLPQQEEQITRENREGAGVEPTHHHGAKLPGGPAALGIDGPKPEAGDPDRDEEPDAGDDIEMEP